MFCNDEYDDEYEYDDDDDDHYLHHYTLYAVIILETQKYRFFSLHISCIL